MIFGKNCVVLCVSNNLILKAYISHQEKYFMNWIIFHHVLNLQIDSASGCWTKMFSGLLQKFLWANDWERRESLSKFVKMQVIWPFLATFHCASHAHILICFDPYEIENVEQKNSSKCSNLICCRGQVQRPFPCDFLAVCRILVLLMRSNEHR